MRTIEETKKLLEEYKQVLKTDIKDQYVIKADNMTLNRVSYSRYDVTKQDWPNTFNKATARTKIKTYSSRYELMKLKVVRYSDWLKTEINKLDKILNNLPEPEPETMMEAFKEIDHPELYPQETEAEQHKEPDTSQITDPNKPLNIDNPAPLQIMTQDQLEESISVLTNPNCIVKCNNCLCCKWLGNILIHLEDSTLKVQCRHPLKNKK